MTLPDDGGDAFPRTISDGLLGTAGMSLRDWFAGMALAGVDMNKIHGTIPELAKAMYEIANAMLEAKEAPVPDRPPKSCDYCGGTTDLATHYDRLLCRRCRHGV